MIGGLCPVAPSDNLRGCVSIPSKVNTLKNAIDEIATLSEADQEEIARQLLTHVAKVRQLRADLQAGVDSLDAGRGHQLDIDDVIARARHRGGRSTASQSRTFT
jgi:predicted transcriptional regulator